MLSPAWAAWIVQVKGPNEGNGATETFRTTPIFPKPYSIHGLFFYLNDLKWQRSCSHMNFSPQTLKSLIKKKRKIYFWSMPLSPRCWGCKRLLCSLPFLSFSVSLSHSLSRIMSPLIVFLCISLASKPPLLSRIICQLRLPDAMAQSSFMM